MADAALPFDPAAAHGRGNGFMQQDPQYRNGHPGIDYDMSDGTPLAAMWSGTIKCRKGDWGPGGWAAYLIGDNGMSAVYGHITPNSAPCGSHVNAGDKIALSDNTGLSSGPHLHLEVHRGSNPENLGDVVNPDDIIEAIKTGKFGQIASILRGDLSGAPHGIPDPGEVISGVVSGVTAPVKLAGVIISGLTWTSKHLWSIGLALVGSALIIIGIMTLVGEDLTEKLGGIRKIAEVADAA